MLFRTVVGKSLGSEYSLRFVSFLDGCHSKCPKMAFRSGCIASRDALHSDASLQQVIFDRISEIQILIWDLCLRRDTTITNLGAVETKLLYTLHWLLLDAAEECADGDAERNAQKAPSYYLFSVSAIQVCAYCIQIWTDNLISIFFRFLSTSSLLYYLHWKNRIFKISDWRMVWKYGPPCGNSGTRIIPFLRRWFVPKDHSWKGKEFENPTRSSAMSFSEPVPNVRTNSKNYEANDNASFLPYQFNLLTMITCSSWEVTTEDEEEEASLLHPMKRSDPFRVKTQAKLKMK